MDRDAGGDPFEGGKSGIHSEVVSRPLPVRGDTVRLGSRLKPGSERGGGVEIELQGSADGMSWVQLMTLTATSRAWASGECAVAQHAWVRLRARVVGGGPVGFDTRVGFH